VLRKARNLILALYFILFCDDYLCACYVLLWFVLINEQSGYVQAAMSRYCLEVSLCIKRTQETGRSLPEEKSAKSYMHSSASEWYSYTCTIACSISWTSHREKRLTKLTLEAIHWEDPSVFRRKGSLWLGLKGVVFDFIRVAISQKRCNIEPRSQYLITNRKSYMGFQSVHDLERSKSICSHR